MGSTCSREAPVHEARQYAAKQIKTQNISDCEKGRTGNRIGDETIMGLGPLSHPGWPGGPF